MKIRNKVVLITGGTSGIGKAAALLFAKEGAKVVVNYHTDAQAATAVVTEIKAGGGTAHAIRADVTKPSEVQSLFASVERLFGTVDVLVNNAGLARPVEFLNITEADLLQDFKLNFFSQVYCAQEAAKIMKGKNGGCYN